MSTLPQIPGYALKAELGRGGMAIVYSAIETNLDREVAIKIVGAAPGDPDGHIERLENEARGLAALHHPHIVDLYRFGRTADGSLYYVMPLLTGGSLEDWPRPVAEDRVVALLDHLLDALAHAHAADIIHRDIKPANILFDRHDRPLLADFGAALMRRRDTRLTMHGGAIGSSGYMSPEQARGLNVDARSDLYSTAVLAFELLTGRRPFEGPDDLAIALAQTEQPIPTLPDALRHWQPFFARALAVNPAQRFADAAAMRAAVQTLRAAVPTARAPRRPSTRTMATVVAAVVLLGALAFAFWPAKPPEPVHATAVEALWNAGLLTPPGDTTVLSELVRGRTQELDRAALDALQQRLLNTLADDVRTAVDGDDGAAAASAWTRWHDAVVALEAEASADVAAQEASLATTLQERLAAALAAYDRRVAATALAIVDLWDAAPAPLRGLADAARTMPALGDRFADEGGPPLVLATTGDGTRPALAVMAAAVDEPLYRRFLDARGRTPTDCAADAAPAQGCIDLATANDFSAWLSEQTQHRYRLPTREELAMAIAHVEPAPAYAWTGDCNQVRVARRGNVASRVRSGVRELFGRRPATQYDTRCDGNFALKLDGRGGETRVQAQATADTAVVLVREMPTAVPATDPRE